MTLRTSAIVAAELRVVESRRGLRHDLHRLQHRLSQPSSLATAAAVGAVFGFSLQRRGRTGAMTGMLVAVLIRRGIKQLVTYGAAYLLRNASSRTTPNARAAALRMTGT